jgi:hypothetical protein
MTSHLYWAFSSPGTNRCLGHLYRVKRWPGVNVEPFVPRLASNRYKCGLTGRVGGLSFPPGTNALICTMAKIPVTNVKSGKGQMPDSLVVSVFVLMLGT